MLQYEDYGEGPPLVLIHGSPGNAQSWRAVGEHLADTFRVLAPTLPGHEDDGSGSEGAASETADLAAAVESLIERLGEPVSLAAHSYGGNVALHVALRGNVPLGRLILLEPVALKVLPALGEDDAFAAAKAVFDAYIARFERGDGRAVATMIDFWFGAGAFAGMPEPVRDYLVSRTAANIVNVKAAFRETYAIDALRDLRVPTLVAHGSKSPEVTLAVARGIARHVADGRAKEIEGADHAMLVTHAREVAEIIAGFAGG